MSTDLILLYEAFKLYVRQGGRKNNRKEFLWYHTDVQVVILFINMIVFVDMIPSDKYFLFLFVVSSTSRRHGVWIFYNEVHVWNNHAFSKKSQHQLEKGKKKSVNKSFRIEYLSQYIILNMLFAIARVLVQGGIQRRKLMRFESCELNFLLLVECQ